MEKKKLVLMGAVGAAIVAASMLPPPEALAPPKPRPAPPESYRGVKRAYGKKKAKRLIKARP